MFKRWKEARATRKAAKIARVELAEKIQNDDYLRRLRNSADMLSGLTHSGNSSEFDHLLKIWEVRSVLRQHLERVSSNP